MMRECLKEGLSLANKSLQLVFIRVAATIINIILLVIFLGIPVLVAIAYLGIDLGSANDLIPHLTRDPLSFFSRYLGLAILVGMSLFFYAAFSSLLFFYVLGGTLGTLRNSAVDINYTISLSSFFQESNRNFFRLLWLVILIFFIIAVLSVFLIIGAGIFTGFIHSAGSENMVQTFLNSFIAIFVGIVCAVIVLAGFVLSIFSLIVAVVERVGAVDALKKSYDFITRNPQAILYFVILLMIVIVVSAVFYGLQVPMHFIPVIGAFMNIFMYLASVFFQSYLAILVWSSLIIYYIRLSQHVVDYSEYEI